MKLAILFLLLSFSAQPDVVLPLADGLGYSDLACYGSDFYETPHLDRLAWGARGTTRPAR